jgi:1-acyl-sn-glycerol-3-phosphate acyltransferase
VSTRPKVVHISQRRRKAGGELEALRERVRQLEQELAREGVDRQLPASEGLLVALAQLAQEGTRAVNWEGLARALRAAYFSWHSEEVDEFGYDGRFTQTLEPFFEFLYTVWWRVETTGIEHVPAKGPGLVVCNHSGVLPWDGLMVNVATRHEHPARRHCRMLALDMFALLPFLAPLLSKGGHVRASQENGERLLRKGELVGVFPEGIKGVGKPFKRRYKLARFGRGGFVRLALRTGTPIIPCAVVGAEEVHPMLANASWIAKPLGFPYFPLTPTWPHLGLLGTVPLPTKWSLDFADPLPMDTYGPEAAQDTILVHRLSEQVRSTVQKMINGRLARRRSIWFG